MWSSGSRPLDPSRERGVAVDALLCDGKGASLGFSFFNPALFHDGRHGCRTSFEMANNCSYVLSVFNIVQMNFSIIYFQMILARIALISHIYLFQVSYGIHRLNNQIFLYLLFLFLCLYKKYD